ncbi:unnamed protein product, partial [Rotaria socialis]
MLSDPFKDPTSLSSIATSLRQSINRLRDPEFMKRSFSTADKFMKEMIYNKRLPGLGLQVFEN